MIDIERVAEVMGGEQVLGRRIRSLPEMSRAVEEGLPKESLRRIAWHIYGRRGRQGLEFIHGIVPEATFKRRRDRLNPTESEKAERVARVVSIAEDVLGSEDDARSFLTTKHSLLQDRTPLDVARTDLGARQVEQILRAVEHGLPV